MNEEFLARKGNANPAATHHGGESRFQARRVVVLPSITLHRGPDGGTPHARLPRQAANMAKPRRKPARRRKFTFRIEAVRHEKFCDAARRLGISRQELLTRALDSYLGALRDEDVVPTSDSNRTVFRAPAPHDSAHTLQLPF